MHEKNKRKTFYRKDINKGYAILYLTILVVIVLGEVFLYKIKGSFSIWKLFSDLISNLMGVLAAFLVFDIAHEKLSKDAYASEVSEQLLDTLMYHPEAMELYKNEHKKMFVNAFVESVVKDADLAQMIGHHLDTYLLTPEEYEGNDALTERDCRIKTDFSYSITAETNRSRAFDKLCEIKEGEDDPYFYVQEVLNYKVKYLSAKGNNAKTNYVKMCFVYDNATLDEAMREKSTNDMEEQFNNCLFRENLDLCERDIQRIRDIKEDSEALINIVKQMIRPSLKIDKFVGQICGVEMMQNGCGFFVEFQVDHDTTLKEHVVDIVFHMPKRWNTVFEVAIVEPTKQPRISLSYDEDNMAVEMYSFLNRGQASAYESANEAENGIYRVVLADEWVYPVSGIVFTMNKKG